MVKVMMIEFTSSQRPKMPQGHGSKNKNKTKKSSELLIQVFFFFFWTFVRKNSYMDGNNLVFLVIAPRA